MAELIQSPTEILAAGVVTKSIREYVGRANTGEEGVSIAHMVGPRGWSEPGQRPEFKEYTLVLHGSLTVQTRDEQLVVKAGQGLICAAGEWVQYSTPEPGGAEYIAVCLSAFSPDTVHRDK